ncbi:TRAF3-interacting protein 1 isoform X2 [Daktulosphaira vitifoliae]|nr:TRAF3-interacting protein 1 isoform X2 [Daktulosphaira vitifoliae]XP_050523230.1 TRAF3-interacting protein 1 isoform X2 [Daktulosphaira vitifoliae]XP_050523231.1 TRAF3-interacting protein 1 isoform X2 [Daktulosphaira vitifoliae]
MTDPTNEELVNLVKLSLSKYIRKPQLTNKLLNKPPFKFLHDIITNIIHNTGYLSGIFSDDELKSQNVVTKDKKVKFLEKLIINVQLTTGKQILAKPSKIVAGLEVTKTLELLITIVNGIDANNKNSQKTNFKTKKKESVRNNIQNINKNKSLDKDESIEIKSQETAEYTSNKSEPTVGQVLTKLDESLSNFVEQVNEKVGIEVNEKKLNGDKEENNSNKILLKNESNNESVKQKSPKKNKVDEQQLRKLNELNSINKPLRPKSSRPPAPNRRIQLSSLPELPKYSDNFFSKNDDLNDIDDNIVSIEVVDNASKLNTIEAQDNDKSQLVSQILETQVELATKAKLESNKVEWEGRYIKEKEILVKQMAIIKQNIQSITKSTNPLSKLINNMQENIDQMNRELNQWKSFNQRTNEKLDLEKRISEDKINPLKIQLEKLKNDIEEKIEMINYAKANIFKNKYHINYLITERFTK